MSKFTPVKITKDFATFAIAIKKCEKCNRDMVVEPSSAHYKRSTFPIQLSNNFLAQAERAGFVIQSKIKVDGEYICTDCTDAGLADFLCALCGKRKLANKKELSFGEPPEYLCSDCYKTTPAKEWDDKIEYLTEQHKYDLE